MSDAWSVIASPVFLAGWVLLAILLFYFLLRFCRVYKYISSDQFGVVEKVFSRKGSVANGFIALNGQAGFQPNILRTGPHFFLPFLYKIHTQNLITVRSIAYVYARDGEPLEAGQTRNSWCLPRVQYTRSMSAPIWARCSTSVI